MHRTSPRSTYDKGLGSYKRIVAVIVTDLQILDTSTSRHLKLDGKDMIVRDPCTYVCMNMCMYEGSSVPSGMMVASVYVPLTWPALEAPVTSPTSIHAPESVDH